MKKGQAALEYLMTYGWAILIIVIIGVALYAMGIFNPSTFVGKKYSGLTAFTVLDWKAIDTTNDTFVVELSPRGHTFSAISATLKYGGATWACTPSSTTMNPSGKYNITCTTSTNVWTKGDTYTNLGLSITYTDQDTGLQHTSTGTFSGKVE